MERICFMFATHTILLYGGLSVFVSSDPCYDYTELWSQNLQTRVPKLGWYRFINTTSGVLVTSCPVRDVCNSPGGVIWINDSSSTNNTEEQRDVTACLRTKDDCCGRESIITMKICNGFIVYQLSEPHIKDVYFCFNDTDTVPSWTIEQSPSTQAVVDTREPATPSVTSSTQTPKMTSHSSNEIKPSSSNSSPHTTAIIVAVVAAFLVLLLIIVIVVLVIRRQKRKSIEVTNLSVQMRKK